MEDEFEVGVDEELQQTGVEEELQQIVADAGWGDRRAVFDCE
jgi:hypothetical protein